MRNLTDVFPFRAVRCGGEAVTVDGFNEKTLFENIHLLVIGLKILHELLKRERHFKYCQKLIKF